MILRSRRERILQTLTFEAGGLMLVGPAYALLFDAPLLDSLSLILSISVAVMVWTPLYNLGCDWLEQTWTNRVASDRPHRWRLIHAALHEVTTIVVTLPVIIWVGGFSFGAALALDLGLSAFFTAYAYVFYLGFDWFRPVKSDQTFPDQQGRLP